MVTRQSGRQRPSLSGLRAFVRYQRSNGSIPTREVVLRNPKYIGCSYDFYVGLCCVEFSVIAIEYFIAAQQVSPAADGLHLAVKTGQQQVLCFPQLIRTYFRCPNLLDLFKDRLLRLCAVYAGARANEEGHQAGVKLLVHELSGSERKRFAFYKPAVDAGATSF